MAASILDGAAVLVVGAGIMGAGIAQVAAQAGHRVMLFDMRDDAAVRAKSKLAATLDGLVNKGRLAADAAQAALARIEPITALDAARGCLRRRPKAAPQPGTLSASALTGELVRPGTHK